jgi:GNAT superfamily N-acetyltransferase
VERLTPQHLPAFVQWCPSLAGGHRLTEAELSAALFPDDQQTWVFGDPHIAVVATALAGRRGFVRLLAVDERHRRHGVGRYLLAAAERQLADDGAVDVLLGADAPHHLWAGVPTGATAMCCLAEAMRYRRVGVNLDVDIPLHSLQPDLGGWRRAVTDDASAVREFCRLHYPDWSNEAARAAVSGTMTVTFESDELAGFCAFDVNRRGALGPVAVRPDLVGRGVGRPALLGALHTMRARGDDIAAVQWVGPLRPYVELGGRISQQYLVYRKALP